jgi:hypothetical protein
MSQENFLKFLTAARGNAAMQARYNQRNLSQLLFHAKNDGFEFTAEEMADMVGKLEANVIMAKDHDPIDATSRLWREMWGRCHFDYLINRVLKRHTDDELRALFTKSGTGGA